MSFKNPNQEKIFQYLDEAKVIAVVGLSDNPDKTSYQIADVLKNYGYKLYGVNPKLAGQKVNDIRLFQKRLISWISLDVANFCQQLQKIF